MPQNLFSAIPDQLPEELFERLFKRGCVQIERIVSKGHSTPAGQWYDQDWDEWVVLLQGQASLRLERQPELVDLKPGDYLLIPAHLKHRVEWTEPETPTIWLAVHIKT